MSRADANSPNVANVVRGKGCGILGIMVLKSGTVNTQIELHHGDLWTAVEEWG